MKNLHKSLGIPLLIIMVTSCKEKPVPPVISTVDVSEISTTTAISGGNISDEGGAPIISKGVCWNTTNDPTIDQTKTTETGTGSFSSNMTQLSPNTTYYVRAYAKNSAGIGYGRSVSFKTLGDIPSSSSTNASNIQINSATLNGTINPNSLTTTVTFEYGITTSYGNNVSAQQSPITGNSNGNINVTLDLTGLTAGTIYHFRIKAENSLGIAYSSDMTFTTLGQVPTALANPATNLQVKAATINGTVNGNYLSSIVVFEWGTTTSYGTTNIPTQSPATGSTPVNVNTDLSGLTPGTTYHFRIKAINELGSTYSNDMTFTTLGHVPTVGSLSVTEEKYSAKISGIVNPNYLSTNVIFEWGITTTYGNTSVPAQNTLTGSTSQSVDVEISGLTSGATYHFRIKATNELGTTVSDDKSLITLAPITDIDGNVYDVVRIGTQVWITGNLNVTKYSNGDPIPNVIDSLTWNHLTEGAYCDYDNTPVNSTTYGKLYNWYTVSNSRNLCPLGWHVPKVTEWSTMLEFLGWNNTTGGKLKEPGFTHWNYPNTGATNEAGFVALPGGMRYPQGFLQMFETGYWWSAPTDIIQGSEIGLFYNRSDFNLLGMSKGNEVVGLSVRCVKD
jgi:uncharacterized protein (TIGR02145 family)